MAEEYPNDTTPSQLVVETYPVVNSAPLRLSLTPSAIREHYDGSSPGIDNLTDEQLLAVGNSVLCSDELYRVFHEELQLAIEELYGLDPEADDGDEDDGPFA